MSLNKRFLTGGDVAHPLPRGRVATCLAVLGRQRYANFPPAAGHQLLTAGAALAGEGGHTGFSGCGLRAQRLQRPGFRAQVQQRGHTSLAARWGAGSFRNRAHICLSCMPGRFFTTAAPAKSQETFNNCHDWWGGQLTARGQRPERLLSSLQSTEEAPRQSRTLLNTPTVFRRTHLGLKEQTKETARGNY